MGQLRQIYHRRGNFPQLHPQDLEMLSHSPGSPLQWFLVWGTPPFHYPEASVERHLFILEQIRDLLLPRIFKKILSSVGAENKASCRLRASHPLTWALLVLVARIITRHWVQVIPIHVTTRQSILRPERSEQETGDGQSLISHFPGGSWILKHISAWQ